MAVDLQWLSVTVRRRLF